MRYKGLGTIIGIKLGAGKINAPKIKTASILRLTQTELIVNRIITPVVFGGHFTNQSPSINGNYLT